MGAFRQPRNQTRNEDPILQKSLDYGVQAFLQVKEALHFEPFARTHRSDLLWILAFRSLRAKIVDTKRVASPKRAAGRHQEPTARKVRSPFRDLHPQKEIDQEKETTVVIFDSSAAAGASIPLFAVPARGNDTGDHHLATGGRHGPLQLDQETIHRLVFEEGLFRPLIAAIGPCNLFRNRTIEGRGMAWRVTSSFSSSPTRLSHPSPLPFSLPRRNS